MDAIETTFTITESEYVRAMRRHNKTQIQFFRDVIASILIIVGGVYLLLFAEMRTWSVFSSWLRDNEFYILYHDGGSTKLSKLGPECL